MKFLFQTQALFFWWKLLVSLEQIEILFIIISGEQFIAGSCTAFRFWGKIYSYVLPSYFCII